MKVKIALTEPQKKFVQSVAVNPAICGGLGSGKTRAGTMRIITRMIQHPGANGGYYMPTYDLLRLRALEGLKEDLDSLELVHKVNESKMTIAIKDYGKIILRSYDRPERIVAYETADAIVDEIDTLPKKKAKLVWTKISERNRQDIGVPNTIAAVTTPDQGTKGFVYEYWVKKATEMQELIKAPTTSNPYLPPGYIRQIKQNYDPTTAKLYINGEFVNLTEELVYHTFDKRIHDTTREIKPGDVLHIGQDFNVGGCCSTVFVIEGRTAYAVDEFVSRDTQDLCIKIKQRYPKNKAIVYPDASGNNSSTNAAQTDVDIIRANSIAVEVSNKNPAIKDRVNSVNALISKGLLLVNSVKCPNLTEALESQGYGKDGNPEKFEEHPSIDDWNDSAGYFIFKRFPVIRPVTPVLRMM